MIVASVINELTYKAARSAGAGGQHVNKVATKVTVCFDIKASKGINEREKSLILSKLATKLTKSGVLIMSCGSSRSQHRNKEIVTNRLLGVLKASLKTLPPRKASRRTKASVQKRLDTKKKQSQKKANRKKPLW